jgi:hypothetical protein
MVAHIPSLSPTFRHSLHPVALFHDEQDILTDFQHGERATRTTNGRAVLNTLLAGHPLGWLSSFLVRFECFASCNRLECY